MLGVKDFAEDVEATLEHVDNGASPAVVTVSGDTESGFVHFL